MDLRPSAQRVCKVIWVYTQPLVNLPSQSTLQAFAIHETTLLTQHVSNVGR
jgi:hypothetical protein